MKAILTRFDALPFDRMELRMLPPGEIDVQIGIRCDREAYEKLVAFFAQAGFTRAKPEPGTKELPPPTKALKP